VLGQEAQAAGIEDSFMPPAATLNDGKTFLTLFAPPCGQAEGESLLPFNRCSNCRLHFLHSYSYMGIISVPAMVLLFTVFSDYLLPFYLNITRGKCLPV